LGIGHSLAKNVRQFTALRPTRDTLAEAQQQASSKEAVLKALDTAAATLRGRLDESLSSVQRTELTVDGASLW